ncbi:MULTISPECIES: hypothetical protein [Sporosarcina]|uniref:Uncharacterized protein n=1 Tax=Sporosarcina newyorkensis 2681 TaxID=1027292 RepID=F9DX25_9BACL|nr:hypothetical protein [Sporosarcina newyorkensis]EGQ21073.1 hypothetical protein HMPREF9372_3356 [Sporosarcina newyorkensis 2681]
MANFHADEYLDRKEAGMYLLGRNIGKGMERTAKMKAPWRDRTGNTRRAIHGGADPTANGAIIYLAHGSMVGTYLEEGTGIYGPRGTPIVPVRSKALRFTVGGSQIFAKEVKGMPKQPIIEPTAKESLPMIEEQVYRYWGST